MKIKSTNKQCYRGYTINTGKNGEYLCNEKTLDQAIDMMEYMTKNHAKVRCCRLDIRIPVESNIDIRKEMTGILKETKRKLEAELKGNPNKVDMQDVWRAEKSKRENEHVHIAIMANDNAVRNSRRIKRIVNEVVKAKFKTEKNGLVHFSESNGKYGKKIDRNSPDFEKQKNEAVYAMSYLAKVRPGDKKAKNARISSASRLPKK